jgi:two-component system, LytTR family, response regulator
MMANVPPEPMPMPTPTPAPASRPVLRAVIADDEPLARARLRRLLGHEPGVDVIAECATGCEAADAMRRTRPDVLFLDVQMPDVDGFGALNQVPPAERPLIVFVTAYSSHAVRAFEEQALDYLLKPISAERLHDAVGRVRQRLVKPAIPAIPAIQTAPPREYPTRIAIPMGSRFRFIDTDDIDYITAAANYAEVHAGGHTFVLRETMTSLEARLDPRRFLRIHRSRIVRLTCIEDIEPLVSGQYVVRLKNGVRLTSGRSYRQLLQKALGIGPLESKLSDTSATEI